MSFAFKKCDIEGLYEVYPEIHADSRGFFSEIYNERAFQKAGLTMKFVQDNVSASSRGVLRGLHYQTMHPQGKLVYTLSGRVFDVAVDLRKGSTSFGHWHGVILDAEKKNMLYIPEGFAHGFLVLSETASFAYKCTDFYDPEGEGGILWNDPTIAVHWPFPSETDPILSKKDMNLPLINVEKDYFSIDGIWMGK